MLSVSDNKLLTRVTNGAPMGELLRRYWHPVAAAGELVGRGAIPVRMFGEDLVLYRDKSGTLGLIDRFCPHRRVDLSYGIPEEHGLRCMYHGWMMDETGQCIEQPFEETVHPDGRFKEKVKVAGYPVQEMAGLVFAYMGPQPAPLLPEWEPLVAENVARDIAITELPCNWLQCQENSLDPVHTEWLHSYFTNYQQTLAGAPESELRSVSPPHEKIRFEVFQHGIIKRRVLRGLGEEHDLWKVGHPILFPNILQVGSPEKITMQFRVPVDDTHTRHISVYTFRAAPGVDVPKQDPVPHYYVDLKDAEDRFVVSVTFNQDYMAWITQGPIARRELEKLGESDRGIILYRTLLKEQMRLAADGADPMNVFRSDAENQAIALPIEPSRGYVNGAPKRYVPQEAGPSVAHADIERVLATYGQPANA